jgi:ribosomal protein L11 methyltransferase
MPYRIDILRPLPDTLDRLVNLGALDIEAVGHGVAALLPDAVTEDAARATLPNESVKFSQAVARDNGSVWLLSPRAVQIGRILIAPSDAVAPGDALRLIDSSAFGTGHHPTTALCLEALEEILAVTIPDSVLDVGTGTGVLALASLKLGVPRAIGLDIDDHALMVATENARLNNLSDRLELRLGGPGNVEGGWDLVVANVLAAPLIEMAPILVRRVKSRGRIILSGIPESVKSDVAQRYRWLGMRIVASAARSGWTALVAQATW